MSVSPFYISVSPSIFDTYIQPCLIPAGWYITMFYTYVFSAL